MEPTLQSYLAEIEIRDTAEAKRREIMNLVDSLLAPKIEEVMAQFESTRKEMLDTLLGAIPSPIRGDKGGKGDMGVVGERGEAGKDGLDGKDGVNGKDGMNGSPDTGKEVVNKINELEVTPEFQIDAKHIKNLPQPSRPLFGAIHRGGVNLQTEVVLEGAVNGSNSTFTVPSNKPVPKAGEVKLFINGIRFKTSEDYTHSERTFTMTTPPPSGGQAPIIDYEAQ